ncbi:MAG: hypothetical protein ABIJ97_12010, partial [Bacteroidota bacterium]
MKYSFWFIYFCLFINFQVFSQSVSKDTSGFDGKTRIELLDEGISINPPAHFRVLKNQAGFIHLGSSSSIQIKEIEGSPYAIVVKGLTKEHFEKQGIKLLAQEEMKTHDGKDGTMFLISFNLKNLKTNEDIPFERLMYFTG